MDLTIDSIQQYAASEQLYLNLLAGCANRYHVSRVCAHATVIKDPTTSMRVRQLRGVDLAMREAQEWQSDQDEDLDAAEVIHHLHQQAKSSAVIKEAISLTERSDAVTTPVKSCSFKSPIRSASRQERPPSSFCRYSFRQSMITYRGRLPWTNSQSNIREFLPDAPAAINLLWGTSTPKIVGEMSLRNDFYAVWHLQLDVVDLLSRRRPGKRRRTTINPFYQMPAPPEQDTSPGNHRPEAKRFKGVHYRRDRRTWAAEMKPPKYKDKVWFGGFKSRAQAARAIDAAFHHYGKPHLLNFPDTPKILSIRPSPERVLNKEDKLRFVREQVKWLAFIASTLPASPPSVPPQPAPQIPESPSRGCNGNTSLFHSISEISSFLSCGEADESDDGISQPLPSLHPDALAELVSIASMEPPFVGADALRGITGSLEEHQGMFEWSSEDAFVDPSLSGWWSPSRSVQITVSEVSSAPAMANLLNFTEVTEPSCESPGSWVNYLATPPASMLPLPPRSPISFHGDVTHGLLETECFGRGEWLRG